MSSQLMDSNPNIADLSDTNRPTKLVEQFSELYDNEWTNAYGVLGNILADEFSVIRFLLGLLEVPKTMEPRAKIGSLDFPSNQSFSSHTLSLSKTPCLVLWLKFPLGLSEQQMFWRDCAGAQARLLCVCAGSPEPLLFPYAITAVFPQRG